MCGTVHDHGLADMGPVSQALLGTRHVQHSVGRGLQIEVDTSSANRDFIQARCQPESDGGEVLESYRSKIVEQFYPKRGFGKLKLAEARKAIRDYRKATGSRSFCGVPGKWASQRSFVSLPQPAD